jgi:hypothetical protein
MKAAIFVDFDNVYTGLKRISAWAATQFASEPIQWLKWLTDGLVNANGQRRVLVRRCYLNPQWYQHYRRAFHEAGFEVIDCPPMTSTGKTSTDIHLVLDAIDALLDPTHFDEFIVFSADADFSPLLRRLRRSDRRTVMFAAGAASKSYKAAADYVIDIDEFLKDALGEGGLCDERGLTQAQPGANVPVAKAKLSPKEFVWQRVSEAKDPLPMPTIAQMLQNQFPGILESKWDGAGSFGAFFARLAIDEIGVDQRNKTAFVRSRMNAATVVGLHEAQTEGHVPTEVVPQSAELSSGQLNSVAVGIIQKAVAAAANPVSFAQLGNHLRQSLPQLQSGWNGAATLGGYLKTLPLGNLKTSELEDGVTYVLFDPAVHAAPGGLVNEPLVAEMLRAADIPPIKATALNRILFHCTNHLGSDEPFEINAASKKIYDTVLAEGGKTGVKRVASVLKALIFGGLDTSARYLAESEIVAVAERVVLEAWSRETQAPVDADAQRRLAVWLRPDMLIPEAS